MPTLDCHRKPLPCRTSVSFNTFQAKRVTPHASDTPTRCSCAPRAWTSQPSLCGWGHESTQTTHIYGHADPALKEQAIARTAPLGSQPGRYRPSDTLLAFLEGL